jgi:hypothetical protein
MQRNEQQRLEQALQAVKGEVSAFPLMGKIENAFDAVGLMRGSLAPLGRAAVGFAVGTGVVYALNGVHMAPFAFDEYGMRRPWIYDDPENGTSFTWWMPGLGVAILFGMFI